MFIFLGKFSRCNVSRVCRGGRVWQGLAGASQRAAVRSPRPGGSNMAAVVSEAGAREAAPGRVCCSALSASMTVCAGIS